MVINIILILFFLVLVPYVFGKVLINTGDNQIFFPWVLGNIFQMSVFFVIAIVFIIIRLKFFVLWKFYTVMLIILFGLSVIFYRNKIRIKMKIGKIDIIKIISIVLIVLQLFVKLKYANINNDDASFVVLSTEMIETNNMYYMDDTGKLNERRALAPISAYYSTLSKQTGIQVTILTHSIIPLIFIVMSYVVYFNIGKKLVKEDEDVWLMMILLSLLNIFSFSIKSASHYMLLYTWFGRSILATTIIPLIWCLSFDAMSKESKWNSWLLIFLAVLSGCLGSEMAIIVLPIILMGLSIAFGISDKKIEYIFKSIICIIPCIIIGVIYLKIK